MDTYDFRVGCDLNYNVNGPSAFIFNVSVVNNSFSAYPYGGIYDGASAADRGIAFARSRPPRPIFVLRK